MSTFPKIDKLAPAFTLHNHLGEKVSLSDFKQEKNVVLYFYPKAMTPGCTTQACALRDHAKTWDKLDSVVLGVSPDPVARLEKFWLKERLNFILLSDEDHKVAEKYGVWGEKKLYGKKFMGILRTTFIIGKDGKLKYILEKVKTAEHHKQVQDLLKN